MASLLPSAADDTAAVAASSSSARPFSLFEEVAKSLISLVEVWGVSSTLQLTPNLGKFTAPTRILAIGLGMGAAESVLKYLIPIFTGARGSEFSWQYLEMGAASNVALLLHLAFVCAVWIRARNDVSKSVASAVWIILATVVVLPSVDSYLSSVLHVSSCTLLAFHAALALALALFARTLFHTYQRQRAGANTTTAAKKAQ